MGNEKSSSTTLSKSDRTQLAKKTVNEIIPSILRTHPQTKKAVSSSTLLVESDVQSQASSSATKPRSSPMVITVVEDDTLAAARALAQSASSAGRVGILNMASPLRPGGGLLTGASSQEESLCMRTTLYPSLREEWYRLPETGVVYSPDVLVFRTPELVDLSKAERWSVDVLTCAALRLPEVTTAGDAYVHQKDRDAMRSRMVQIMRVARMKGVRKLVLGAFGCGAYGNPPKEVAQLWKSVLCGTARRPAEEFAVEEVVFAIKALGQQGKENLTVFEATFT
ncbi:hypothetical protein BKA62DRAFT_695755 [Auriculariales sp. MPI-PUGE-AT-0066]|nr:hypothetical protein BKA62DRAFT_695755 [Auriculariales sp. MPI-PUGE-AT-0066]